LYFSRYPVAGWARAAGPRPPTNVLTIALSSILTLFLAADTFVFAQYKQHIDFAYLQMFFSPAGREIFVFPTSLYFLACLGIVLVVALEIAIFLACRKFSSALRYPRYLLLASILLSTLTFNGMHAWAAFTAYTPVLVRAEAFPAFHPLTARRLMGKLGFTQATTDTIPADTGTLNYPIAPIQLGAAKNNPGKPNIILVLVDSLRFDAITAETMPRLHKRSATAIRFKNHVSGGNATRCGVFSLFYSIPATYWHSFQHSRRPPVFMETLCALDYEFAIFASARLDNPEFDQTVFSGIPNLQAKTDGNSVFERDLNAQNEFLRFCADRNRSRPFFGFLFPDALHSFQLQENASQPFQPSWNAMNYLRLSSATDPIPIRNLYKNQLHNLDIQLDALFSSLEQDGLMKNSIVILTGDHGQEINETHTNAWGHNSNFSRWQTQVPLLVFWPGKPPATHDHRTSHLDIVPTLLADALGINSPVENYSFGKNLFDTSPRPFILMATYSKSAILSGDTIMTLNKYGLGAPRSFDYAQERPPISAAIIRDALRESLRFRAVK
jgi:membrane-anchored protein YejM (alkaline phosphatase superfamily)